MKQLVLLSGKGGTGKTSVAAAFAHLACVGPSLLPAVLADSDVDAANLALVLAPERIEGHPFVGGSLAFIEPGRCEACGICQTICRFDAVIAGDVYRIDPIACEGCAACMYVCPTQAIHLEPQLAGHWYRSQTRYGPLYHASLRPAQANSGKLVTLVKQQARLHALDGGYAALIVDGPPGIGCPVISAASGADLALIVAEPTLAGIHDMRRALQTTAHFRVPSLVCLNKWDVYPDGAQEIEAWCREQGTQVAGRIPFDQTITQAMAHGEPVTAHAPGAPASQALLRVWNNVAQRLIAGKDA